MFKDKQLHIFGVPLLKCIFLIIADGVETVKETLYNIA